MPRTSTNKQNEDRVKLRGLGQLYRREGTGNWHASFSANGQQHRETTGTDKYNAAVSFLKRRIGELENGTFTDATSDKTTVGDILQLVIDDYRMKGQASLDTMVAPCMLHLQPAFGNMRASRLTAEYLREYVKKRLAAKAQASSINRSIAVLRRAYKLGVKAGKVNAAKVPDFSEVMLPERNTRTGFWSHDEYTCFRDALVPHARNLFVFGYWTGCRFAEITGIVWDQVDLAGRAIRLREDQTKAREARIIPLAGPGTDLYDMLVAQRDAHKAAGHATPWVFFTTTGGRQGRIKREWLRAMKATGIQRLFHDLRRTGVRNLVRAGVPEKVAMLISGHKTRSVFERYNIVDESDLRKAAEAVNQHLNGTKKDKE